MSYPVIVCLVLWILWLLVWSQPAFGGTLWLLWTPLGQVSVPPPAMTFTWEWSNSQVNTINSNHAWKQIDKLKQYGLIMAHQHGITYGYFVCFCLTDAFYWKQQFLRRKCNGLHGVEPCLLQLLNIIGADTTCLQMKTDMLLKLK